MLAEGRVPLVVLIAPILARAPVLRVIRWRHVSPPSPVDRLRATGRCAILTEPIEEGHVSTRLPEARAALEAMADGEGLDILVVGGGATGAGAALDAATRGLRTGIVEAQDWGAGTSSRSSKLVHGGLRYLQALELPLVLEALRERDVLLRHVAPHLVRPTSFLYPLRRPVWERVYVGVGLAGYDLLAALGARGRALPAHRHLSAAGARRAFPALRAGSLRGAVRYWDGQVDDARLVLALVRTAVGHGALAASRTRVVDLTHDGERVTGAVVEHLADGRRYRIAARHVISATGVWTEEVEAMAPTRNPAADIRVLASKGVHVVVPRNRLPGQSGIILPTATSVLFFIPWHDHWVIGTTDTPWQHDPPHPVASATDVDYLLEQASTILTRPLTRADVVATFAGLRPLVRPARVPRHGAGSSSTISREHVVTGPAPGLSVVAGGKLTTYRVMAADAVDHALGSRAARQRPSITAQVPLVGAAGFAATRRRRDRIARGYGWSAARTSLLLERYGSEIDELLRLIDASPGLARPLRAAAAHLAVEVVFAATVEGARHLDDVLDRRLRLGITDHGAARAAAGEVAALLAPYLGWDGPTRAREVEQYRAGLDAADEAARMPDDDAAVAAHARLSTATGPQYPGPQHPDTDAGAPR